jgi:hypothetical protein
MRLEMPTMPANSEQDEVLRALSLLTPCAARGHSKIRAGDTNDGGYVMLDDVREVDCCLSLGIGHDVSWDLAMAERGATILQYDHTVDAPPHPHRNFVFKKIGIGPFDQPHDNITSIDTILKEARKSHRTFILKMDIEGLEWEVLDALDPAALRCFSQIVCEFHWFSNLLNAEWRARAQRVFSKIRASHFPVHVHGNNFPGFAVAYGVMVPSVLEVTFVASERYVPIESNELFPTPLDLPNDPNGPDLFLGSFKYSPQPSRPAAKTRGPRRWFRRPG